MEIGDLLVFNSMGAYTTASASNFNGFPKAKIVVVD
jgi:diaminopimelate decarboxylase